MVSFNIRETFRMNKHVENTSKIIIFIFLKTIILESGPSTQILNIADLLFLI